ncbi:MAG TPA: ABC transporter permease [Egibacteraceae bacterium]
MTAATATSPAAGPLQRLRAQTAMELRLLLRNGENLLVAFGIPLLVLVFFSLVDVLPTDGRPVDFLVPGVLALSVMSTALVSLGISTGFERYYLVLKRLGATPLRRSELVAAKALAVCAVEAVQVVVVIGVAAWGLGWRASAPRLGLALAAMLAGTAAFAGIGLAMAGRLRAVATLALANVTYVVLLLTSGIAVPLERLPAPLATVARLLPAAPLAQLLRAALGDAPVAAGDALVLGAWAVGATVLAARVFRWE